MGVVIRSSEFVEAELFQYAENPNNQSFSSDRYPDRLPTGAFVQVSISQGRCSDLPPVPELIRQRMSTTRQNHPTAN